ncbi:MAG: hypothetical protein RLZZ215_2534 [Pseudomonadota bacterium]|jgi:non-heme chloroperoxidase
MNLEIIQRSTEPQGQPILFVHGILSAAWIWDVYFLNWFAAQGYQAYALSLRGHGHSPSDKPINRLGLADFVDDLRQAVLHIHQQTGKEPILVGHSMGGMVVQRYLSEYRAPAALLACSVPPQGMMPVSMISAWTNPFLAMKMARLYSQPEQTDLSFVRDVLFYHPVSTEHLQQWFQHTNPESMRLLWDMNVNLPLVSQIKLTPLAVLGARHDRLVPASVVHWTAGTYGCPLTWANAGHAIMLEQNWTEIAQAMHADLQRLLNQA